MSTHSVQGSGGIPHYPVEPDNRYWRDRAIIYEAPDGWRVVLCDAAGIS
jgi:hypothetical protein